MMTYTAIDFINDAVSEMKELPECLDAVCRDLSRQDIRITREFCLECESYSEVRTEIDSICDENNISLENVYMEYVPIHNPESGTPDPGVKFIAFRKQTDDEWAKYIGSVYMQWLKLANEPISQKEWFNLYQCITSKLYTARNITCDVKQIEECLSYLDKIYLAMNYDANGQMTISDRYIYTKRLYGELKHIL